jgi:hypothetical protein
VSNTITETCISGNNTKKTYAHEDQPDELYEQLLAVFPWVNRENYFSISTPTPHEIFEEPVITCCMTKSYSEAVFGPDVVLTCRKFCMNTATSYLRTYFIHRGENPDWLPEGCTLMFATENHAEFGRPYNEIASTFTDFYFSGDAATVEQAFGLEEHRGNAETLYGVTVKDGEVVRAKQYCYEEENIGSRWIALYNHLTERDS